MLYQAYQTVAWATEPMRALARTGLAAFAATAGEDAPPALRGLSAALAMTARATLSHDRPPFAIDTVVVGNREVAVREEVALALPFCDLIHFVKEDVAVPQPRMLLVAPLSGHFATLLRHTVETLLADHDVYITDWKNARDVPVAHGGFGLDDYVDYLMRFIASIGPGAHVLAVCQPCVQALAAVAVMAADKHPAQPRSLTLMAGPIDTRVNPTAVNTLATSRPMDWFERHLIASVPFPFPGVGRRVYPGFVQLAAFMSMNMERHVDAHRDMFRHLADGRAGDAASIAAFYDEYFAVLDLPAEFYLETVATIFQEARLARGALTWRGREVDPGAIRRTALLTVEGERDDICSVGQTAAAHALCTGLRPHLKRHHHQPGVGHYGTFSGRRWQSQIYPVIRSFVLATN
ncbi:MAG: polyhydroxyalkanoate depolymerase [Rhodospirillales bacterium]